MWQLPSKYLTEMGRRTLLCLVFMPLVFGLTIVTITVRLVRLPVLALPVLISVPVPLTPPVVVLLFPVPAPANSARFWSEVMSTAGVALHCLLHMDATLDITFGQACPLMICETATPVALSPAAAVSVTVCVPVPVTPGLRVAMRLPVVCRMLAVTLAVLCFQLHASITFGCSGLPCSLRRHWSCGIICASTESLSHQLQMQLHPLQLSAQHFHVLQRLQRTTGNLTCVHVNIHGRIHVFTAIYSWQWRRCLVWYTIGCHGTVICFCSCLLLQVFRPRAHCNQQPLHLDLLLLIFCQLACNGPWM